MCPTRRSPSLLRLSVLTLLACLFVPVISHAIQSISPTTLVTGRSNAVTLTMEPNEFDAGGNIVNFQVWLQDGTATSVWVLVPQFVDQVTVFVAVPATATGTGFVGHAGCTDYDRVALHQDPFTCGGNTPMFSLTAYDPGNPPPPVGANIVTAVSPTKLTRGHAMTLQLSYDAITYGWMDVGLQYQSGGNWTSTSIHRNWLGSTEFWCDTSPCTVDVDIPADADLGTAYISNLYDGTDGDGPQVPVTIIDWPPMTLTGIAPDTTQGGVNSLTVTLTGSGFQNADMQVRGGAPATTYASTVLSDTQIQATVPATELVTPRDLPIWVQSSGFGYQTNPVTLHLVPAGGSIAGLSITSLAPTRAAAGKCTSMIATTSLPFTAWGASPFLAYTYPVPTGTDENPGPAGTTTGALSLTADMFSTAEGTPNAYQIDFQLCLPDTALAGQGLLAPGALVNGQPTAWAYSGVAYTVVQLFDSAFVGYTAISPDSIGRGQPESVTLQPTPAQLSDGATAMAEFHYTVGGTDRSRTVVAQCDSDSCSTTITLPGNADLGPGYVLNPDAVDTFPGVVAPFTVVEAPKIVSITPASAAPGSPDTMVTLKVSGYDPAVTDLWIYTPDLTYYLIGTDLGSFEVIDSTTVHMTIPASLLTSPTTLTVELYNNDTSEYFDTDFPVQAPSGNASMILGDLQQSGNQVIAPISWNQPVTSSAINCGTSPAQNTSANPASCIYSAPGTYTVTGSADGKSPDPLTVTISSLDLQSTGLTASIQGHAQTSFTTYSDPVPVDLAAAFSLSGDIGIPDALDPDASSVTITRAEGGSTSGTFTTRDGLTWGGRVHLGPGTYSLALAGQSLLGQPLSASTSLTITQVTATLSTEPLAQAGASVQLPVTWPSDSSLSAQEVDCGTDSTQSFSGTSGTCTYSQAGSYTVQGRFTDRLGTAGIRTAPVSVLVPAVPPGPAVLRAAPANGQTPTHSLTGDVPVATYGAPTVYPVPTAFTLAFDSPTGDQVGIADPLDVTHSKLYVRPMASAADLAAPVDAHDQILSLQDTGEGSYRAAVDLQTFVPTSGDPATWQQRVLLQGETLTGTPVSATLQLQGPRADAAQIQYTGQRINPIYPYAPATVRYVTTNLHSAISGEPITQAWATSDGQGRAVVGDGPVDLTFPTAGTKTVTLMAGGPLTQAKVATDTVVVPTVPAAAIAFTTTVPTKNRPPAAYRFAPNYPPLQPGEHLVGSPSWSVTTQSDLLTVLGQFTGTPFYFTFTAPGSYAVTVSQSTSIRTLYGQSLVTVSADQPPTATLDCSSSYISKTTNPWQYVLSCKAVNAVDPDGTIKSYTWALPNLGYSLAGTATWHYSFTVPQAVTVTLTLRDDSYATCAPCGQTVLQTTFDLRTLH